MLKHSLAAALLVGLAGSGTALADDDCRVPMDQWQSRAAVQKMAEARGWTVSRIRIDDGCYQIKGTDENGQAFKAKLDPSNLAIVKMKHRSRGDGADDRHHGRNRPNPGEDGGRPANELFKSGTPPKVEVK